MRPRWQAVTLLTILVTMCALAPVSVHTTLGTKFVSHAVSCGEIVAAERVSVVWCLPNTHLN